MAITKQFQAHTELKAEDLNELINQTNDYIVQEGNKKPSKVDVSELMTEGSELPLADYYTYGGRPVEAFTGLYAATDEGYIAICNYHYDVYFSIILYVKNEQNKYIFRSHFYSHQASTPIEQYVSDIFTGIPVTHTQNGVMTKEDKVTFDEMVTEVFPLTVAVASSNAGTREVGTSVTPNIVLSITRKGADVSSSAVTTSNAGSVQSDNKTITDSAKTSGTTTYRISVSQGGQTKAVADQAFKFLNYVYGGELSSKPSGVSAVKTQIESWGSSHGVLSDKKNSTAITSDGEVGLAASKYYLFAVKQTASGVPVTLIVKNANSGGTIDVPSSDKGSDLQITRVNGSGSDYYSWVIVPASPNSWTFKIVNS